MPYNLRSGRKIESPAKRQRIGKLRTAFEKTVNKLIRTEGDKLEVLDMFKDIINERKDIEKQKPCVYERIKDVIRTFTHIDNEDIEGYDVCAKCNSAINCLTDMDTLTRGLLKKGTKEEVAQLIVDSGFYKGFNRWCAHNNFNTFTQARVQSILNIIVLTFETAVRKKIDMEPTLINIIYYLSSENPDTNTLGMVVDIYNVIYDNESLRIPGYKSLWECLVKNHAYDGLITHYIYDGRTGMKQGQLSNLTRCLTNHLDTIKPKIGRLLLGDIKDRADALVRKYRDGRNIKTRVSVASYSLLLSNVVDKLINSS